MHFIIEASVMAKYIRIRHFGPISESGELEVRAVMVFCGQQGSGKSTIAKLISTCSWIEKALVRKEISRKDLTAKNFRERYCGYHYLSNFFIEGKTYIHYQGERVDIQYRNDTIAVIEKEGTTYHMPQIMYVPAERNFMVAVEQAEKIRNLPPSLLSLQQVFKKALNAGDYKIPIDGFSVHYDKLNKIAWLHGKDYRLRLHEAASGLQSVIPLMVVSAYLSLMVERGDSHEMSAEELEKLQREVNNILEDKSLNEALRRILIEQLNKRYRNECFLNIVEEPEQNLFPLSQRDVLHRLLAVFNANEWNGLVITTHSPYIIDELSLAVKAETVMKKAAGKDIGEDIRKVLPVESCLSADKLGVYEIRADGTVAQLPDYDGLPSDDNYLNASLMESNERFNLLLEIEDALEG